METIRADVVTAIRYQHLHANVRVQSLPVKLPPHDFWRWLW
jgi:hypothetical protein